MIETRNVDELSPLPTIEVMPRWAQDDPQWHAFVADIERNGIRHPIQITEDGLVVDGWTRRQAAVAAGLENVPVEVVDKGEIYESVMREIRRRHMTKGATAYCVFPFVQDAYLEAVKKGTISRAGKLTNGQNPNVSPSATEWLTGDKRVEDIALGIGVSRELLRQAARVWEIFEEDPAYRDQIEPEILSGEIGLGAVIQGYAGRKATIGRERPPTQHWILISKSMDSWKAWPRYWKHLDEAEKGRIRDEMQQGVSAMPAEARHMLATAIRWAEKKEREASEHES